MRALISGGCGFLGSHLVETLLWDKENQIEVVDNFATSPLPLEQLNKEMDFKRVRLNQQSIERFWGEYEGRHYDVVFHLASIVGPAKVLEHGGKIARSIISNADFMADIAKESNALFVDISTSEVYGGGVEGYCSEHMKCVVSPGATARKEYAVGKLASEIALQNDKKLRLKIIRPFNIAGPRQSGLGGFVLPRFLMQAMLAKPLTVFGDGEQQRAFTDVRDIVKAILLIVNKGDKVVYNVGNPKNRCSINRLAQEVIDVVGSNSEIQHVDPKEIYGKDYEGADDKFPDAHAIEELGWYPNWDRLGIIQSTLDYFFKLPVDVMQKFYKEIGLN